MRYRAAQQRALRSRAFFKMKDESGKMKAPSRRICYPPSMSVRVCDPKGREFSLCKSRQAGASAHFTSL